MKVYTLKALWDGQGKIKMYYGMSRVKKQLSGKRSIPLFFTKSLVTTCRKCVRLLEGMKNLRGIFIP